MSLVSSKTNSSNMEPRPDRYRSRHNNYEPHQNPNRTHPPYRASRTILSILVGINGGLMISKALTKESASPVDNLNPPAATAKNHNLLIEEVEPKINFEMSALNPEVAKHYKNSLVKVHRTVKSGYDYSDGVCTGVHIGAGKVLTAAHCSRGSKHGDPNSQRVTNVSGKDIRDKIWVSRNDRNYNISQEIFFPEYDNGDNNYDVELLSVDELNNSSLPLANSDPKAGDAVYLYSSYQEEVGRVHAGRVIRDSSEDNPLLMIIYPISETDDGICEPGTSGTAVINGVGEIVGINVANSNNVVIDSGFVRSYGLDESTLGQLVNFCWAVPVSTAAALTK